MSGSGWLADDLDDVRDGYLDVIRRQIVLFDTGEVGNPAAPGTSGAETLFGEAGFDIVYGQGGADTVDGGSEDDYLEGNADHDTIYGQGGQDDIVGGTGRTISDDPSSAKNGRLDTDDDLFGGDGAGGITEDDFDVVMGDNATVLRGDPPGTPGGAWAFNTFNDSIRRVVFLYDVGVSGAPVPEETNGPDQMFGELDDDVMYGQGDGDHMEGAAGDDYMEGNEGTDTILGEDGNDDMIGGTGRINFDPPTGTDGRLDAAEQMSGGDGFDVMAGDNAIIRRVIQSGSWLQNTFNDGVQHERVQLLDLASLSNPNVPGDVSGGDTMEGNADDDVMYGQGNAGAADDPDVMSGNAGDDYMEGNAGGDIMDGNANQDDMIGGTGRVNQDPAGGTNGRFDGDDTMFGHSAAAGEGGDGLDDYDVMTGDNSIVTRPLTPLPAGDWKVNTFNDGIERAIVMLDLEVATQPAVDGRVHGDDTMSGNGDDDIMRGQGGDDAMHGNDGDDDMQGNHAVDHMWGDNHQDDMIGGSSVADRRDGGDFMFGGMAHDVMTGDNATITRPLTPLPAGDWVVQTYRSPDRHRGRERRRVPRPARRARRRSTGSCGRLPCSTRSVHPDRSAAATSSTARPETTSCSASSTTPTRRASATIPNITVLCDGVTPARVDDPDVLGADSTQVPIEGDLLCGESGEDAVVGDQGTIVDVVETGSAATTLDHNGSPFMKEPVRLTRQLTRQVTLTHIVDGGDDVILGGLDHDSIHAGSGNDLANGGDYVNPQADVAHDILFMGDDIDAGWGGPGHDHLYGGYEADFLDVQPRRNAVFPPNGDPLSWFLFAADDPDTVGNPATPFGEGYDGYQGLDIIYGGWAADAMQANEGGNGVVPGDRLIDWVGVYNAYYVCPPTYGEHISTRQLSPSLQTFLIALAGHDGATTVGSGNRTNSSGFNELAFVYKPDLKLNQNPPHPDTPAHFSCE